jgi:hypothetical protein
MQVCDAAVKSGQQQHGFTGVAQWRTPTAFISKNKQTNKQTVYVNSSLHWNEADNFRYRRFFRSQLIPISQREQIHTKRGGIRSLRACMKLSKRPLSH